MARRACGAWSGDGPLQPMERRSEAGVVAGLSEPLALQAADRRVTLIDVRRPTPCVRVSLRKDLKAHRTASSLRDKKGNLDG